MEKTKLPELKPKDKVRILARMYAPQKWGDIWASPNMDEMVGSIREVDAYNSIRDTYVVSGFNFPRECLEPVSKEVAKMEATKNVEDLQNMDRFNAGDEVIVTAIVEKQKGWEAIWNPKMNFAVGKKLKVIRKSMPYDMGRSSGYELATSSLGSPFLNDENYWFPEAALSAASGVDVKPLMPQTKSSGVKKKRVRVGPGPWDAAPCTHLRWHLMGFFREKLAFKKTKTMVKAPLPDGTLVDVEADIASVQVVCTKCGTSMTLNAK